MKLYEVKLRYVVEETYHIEATTKEKAIDDAWACLEEGDWQRIRNYEPQVRVIKS